jgi:hypothetical protein
VGEEPVALQRRRRGPRVHRERQPPRHLNRHLADEAPPPAAASGFLKRRAGAERKEWRDAGVACVSESGSRLFFVLLRRKGADFSR